MKGTGFCGINCHTCPIYQATVEDKPEERAKLAREWNKTHQTTYKASQMICLGCKSNRPFAYSDECEIRECNISRGLKNCGGCLEFPCKIGREFWKTMPEEYENLKKIHRLLFKDVADSVSEFEEPEEEGIRSISKRGALPYEEHTQKNHQEHAINKPVKKKAAPLVKKNNPSKKKNNATQDD